MHRLPLEYELSHRYSFLLYDAIVDFIISGEPSGIFNVSFKPRLEMEIKEFENLDGEEIWDWLLENNYKDILREMIYRQSCLALISDFCHFVITALECSAQERLTTAFALLRKPFTENLFFLEWLLTDRDSYLNTILEGDPEKLYIHCVAPNPESKKRIIDKAIQNTEVPNRFNTEYIYDLRYNKQSEHGFQRFWQKATHLITKYKHLRTEPQNINMIFLEKGLHEDHWEFLYSSLPVLLEYAFEVGLSIISNFTEFEKDTLDRLRMRIYSGAVLWDRFHNPEGGDEGLNALIEDLNQRFTEECLRCGSSSEISESTLIRIFDDMYSACPKCRGELVIVSRSSE